MYLIYIIATNKMDPFLARICTEAKEAYNFLEECGCGEDEDECDNFEHALEILQESEISTEEILCPLLGSLKKCKKFFDERYRQECLTSPRIIVYHTDGNHMKEIMENLRIAHWEY